LLQITTPSTFLCSIPRSRRDRAARHLAAHRAAWRHCAGAQKAPLHQATSETALAKTGSAAGRWRSRLLCQNCSRASTRAGDFRCAPTTAAPGGKRAGSLAQQAGADASVRVMDELRAIRRAVFERRTVSNIQTRCLRLARRNVSRLAHSASCCASTSAAPSPSLSVLRHGGGTCCCSRCWDHPLRTRAATAHAAAGCAARMCSATRFGADEERREAKIKVGHRRDSAACMFQDYMVTLRDERCAGVASERASRTGRR